MDGEQILKYLTVPNTGIKLSDGSIVMLSRFPDTKWIVHYGWYTYNSQENLGWYFSSIPAQTILPANDQDLQLLTVISTGCDCPTSSNQCAPAPIPHPGYPMPGMPHGGMPPHVMYELDRAFLTVDTIAQRNELNRRLLPDGKIVRVNNAGESPKYYEWNQVKMEWVELKQDAADEYLTKTDGDSLYASKNDLSELSEDVTNVDENITELSRDVSALTETVNAISPTVWEKISE